MIKNNIFIWREDKNICTYKISVIATFYMYKKFNISLKKVLNQNLKKKFCQNTFKLSWQPISVVHLKSSLATVSSILTTQQVVGGSEFY